MDSLLALLVTCSLHLDDPLLHGVIDAFSAGNPWMVRNVALADDDEQLALDPPPQSEAEARAAVARILAAGGEPVVGLLSASLGPVSATAGNVYWGEQRTIEFTYVRSSATSTTLPAPRTVIRTVTLQDEFVAAIAGIGDCVFAVVSRNGSDRIDRVCPTQLNSSVYVASGQLGALAIDTSGLYFIEDGVGLRRLSPIDSTTPGTVTVASGGTRVVPTADFVYFIQNGRGPAGTCGNSSSIRRIPKTGGAVQVIEPGPLSCPLGLAVDDDFVYWSETAGSVKRSGRDAQ